MCPTPNSLQLQLKFDDGFAAYLNGGPILSRLAPDELTHNSLSAGDRSDDVVLSGDVFNLSGFQPWLVDGSNTLSFHVLNHSRTSSDLLLVPELFASTAQASNEIRYLPTPTPGAANGLGVNGFVDDISFSVDRGFFEQPFDVEITSTANDATIYYTTEGSVPTPRNAAATAYTVPIRIATTTNLRGAAHKDGFQPSNTDTQTYLFLDSVLQQDPVNDPTDAREYPATWQGNVRGDYEIDPRVVTQWDDVNADNDDWGIREALTSLPTMSLTLDHDDLWDRSNGIYSNADATGERWRRAGSVEYFDPNSDDQFQYDVGIHMHGNASRFNERLLKHSFRLRFSPQYGGPGKLEFPLFDNSDFADINQVVLRASFTDAFATRSVTNRYSPLDSTYLRDVWMRDTQLAAGGAAAQSSFVHLYINGLYWGLYSPAEKSSDQQFFTGHFGGEEEDWDIIKDFNELSSGNRTAWNQLFSVSRSIRSTNANAKFQEIQGKDDRGNDDPSRTNLLDMQPFIDYMLLHFYAGVEDWPSHNWHAGFNRVDPGKGFQFLTWDQEIGLDQLVRDRSNVSDENTPAELYSDLRRSSDFRLLVADRIQALFFDDGPLTVEQNQQRWTQRAEQIEKAIIGESARWGDAREGQRVAAYNRSSPLDDGPGQIPRGTQTIPLMTVDHWRESIAYVRDTFFAGAFDLFIVRMRADSMLPSLDAPQFLVNGSAQHGGEVEPDNRLTMLAEGDVYYTLDGTDPRAVGGEVAGDVVGTRYTTAIELESSTTVQARTLLDGVWSPLTSAGFTLASPQLPGDVTGDQVVNHEDIDAVFAAVQETSPDPNFDLNEDEEVNSDDADFLIKDILNTYLGDFDLDGRVGFSDFLMLSANFGASDVGWAQGDANGDTEITFADFLLLSTNFGNTTSPAI